MEALQIKVWEVEQEESEPVSQDMAEKVEERKLEVATETVPVREKQPTWTLPLRLESNEASVSLAP